MSLYSGPRCKLCRREGIKLYLKGQKCFTAKCEIEKRPKPPGQTARGYKRLSEYGLRLREKQRVKRAYGLRDAQFKRFFWLAKKMKGSAGENLLILLERRLDNVLYRSGYAYSIPHARQMIVHQLIKVNGVCVKSPSFLIKPGDEITFKDKYVELAKKIKEVTKEYITIPAFLNILAEDPPRIRVIANPTMQDARVSFNMQYVVEYYTR